MRFFSKEIAYFIYGSLLVFTLKEIRFIKRVHRDTSHMEREVNDIPAEHHIMKNINEEFNYANEKQPINNEQISHRYLDFLEKTIKVKRSAIIHVGPYKTGSTTLQQVIYTSKTLADDLYEYPKQDDVPGIHGGMKSSANLANCIRNDSICDEKFWLSIFSFLVSTIKKDCNLIISAEDFSNENNDLTKLKQLLQPWQNVKIVVFYRHFYEWLSSWYFELHRPKKISKLRSQKPEIYPSLVDFLTKENILLAKNTIYTSAVVDRYRTKFNDVAILNMHNTSDAISTFFCDFVPGAEKTCNATKVAKHRALFLETYLYKYEVSSTKIWF